MPKIKELKDKISKMEKGLSNENIAAPQKEILTKALKNAKKQLAELESENKKSTSKTSVKKPKVNEAYSYVFINSKGEFFTTNGTKFIENYNLASVYDHSEVAGVLSSLERTFPNEKISFKEYKSANPDLSKESMRIEPKPKSNRKRFSVDDYVTYKTGDLEVENWVGQITKVIDLGEQNAYRIDAYLEIKDANKIMYDSSKHNEVYDDQLRAITGNGKLRFTERKRMYDNVQGNKNAKKANSKEVTEAEFVSEYEKRNHKTYRPKADRKTLAADIENTNELIANGFTKAQALDIYIGMIVPIDGEAEVTTGLMSLKEEYKKLYMKEISESKEKNIFEAGYKYLSFPEGTLEKLGFRYVGLVEFDDEDYKGEKIISKLDCYVSKTNKTIVFFQPGQTGKGGYSGLYSIDFKEGRDIAVALINKPSTYVKDVDFYMNGKVFMDVDKIMEILTDKSPETIKEIVESEFKKFKKNQSPEKLAKLESLGLTVRKLENNEWSKFTNYQLPFEDPILLYDDNLNPNGIGVYSNKDRSAESKPKNDFDTTIRRSLKRSEKFSQKIDGENFSVYYNELWKEWQVDNPEGLTGFRTQKEAWDFLSRFFSGDSEIKKIADQAIKELNRNGEPKEDAKPTEKKVEKIEVIETETNSLTDKQISKLVTMATAQIFLEHGVNTEIVSIDEVVSDDVIDVHFKLIREIDGMRDRTEKASVTISHDGEIQDEFTFPLPTGFDCEKFISTLMDELDKRTKNEIYSYSTFLKDHSEELIGEKTAAKTVKKLSPEKQEKLKSAYKKKVAGRKETKVASLKATGKVKLTKRLLSHGVTQAMVDEVNKTKEGVSIKVAKQTPGANAKHDRQRTAMLPGKRLSADGKIYYEYRKDRSDKDPSKRI